MTQSKVIMILIALVCNVVCASEQSLQTTVMTPQQWDADCFSVLPDHHKKIVIFTCKTTQDLLQAMQRNVHKGADAFLKSSGQLLNFYNQTMAVFLPTVQESERCVVLPCHSAYKELREKYQTYDAVVRALDVLPSVDLIWKILEDFLPEQKQLSAENLKQGVTKGLRKAAIKNQVELMINQQINGLNQLMEYITQTYSDLVIEQQREQQELEKILAKELEKQKTL